MTIQGGVLDPTTRAFMCASEITRSVGNQCISASPGNASAAVVNSMEFRSLCETPGGTSTKLESQL